MKVFLFFLFLSGLFCFCSGCKSTELKKEAATEGFTLEQAAEKVVAELYANDTGKRVVFVHPQPKNPGDRIASWKKPDEVVVETFSWFFFIDEEPEANWEHKARYVLVEKASGTVHSFPTTTPPKEMGELIQIYPAAK